MATRFGISKLVVGLTVVAIGTSAPEFAVSGYAAYKGAGEMALANVVGSNIFNLGFILALCAIILPLSVTKPTVYRDVPVLLLGSALLAFFALWDGQVQRWEGTLLLVGLLSYILYLIQQARRDKSQLSDVPEVEEETGSTGYALLILLGGLVALLLGCNLMVNTAEIFAKTMGFSEWFIGITVIAIGTSLPELVTALSSVLKKDADIGVGGLVGSDIFNILGVIGVSAVINPMAVSDSSRVPFYFLLFATTLTWGMLRRGWRLSRLDGLALLVIATARYGFEIFS